MKISWPLFEKGPGVKEFVDWLLGLSVFICQPVSKIFIGFGLTVHHEDRLLVIFAEKKSKGKCVLSEKWQTI